MLKLILKAKWLASMAMLTLSIASTALAQTVMFSDVNDALAGRCYDRATTVIDPTNPNRLLIGIHSGIDAQTFQNKACVASTAAFNPLSTLDTVSFLITAPDNYYISRITFTQSGSTSGSNSGTGFRGATWVVDDDAMVIPSTSTGWLATLLNSDQTKRVIPVQISTFLAAGGGGSRSGSASASNPSVLVELLPVGAAPTATAPNTAPTITAIAAQAIDQGAASPAIGFTVGDLETPLGSLTVNASSNNQTLVPNGNIAIGGSGANRTVTVTPAANQNGVATITLTVSDAQLSTPTSFQLTVRAPNTAPTITEIADQGINQGSATGAIAFTVGDLETPSGALTVNGSSNNTTLVPNGNIAIGGSGANRTVTVTAAANQSGVATITLTVSDGPLSAQTSFQVTVIEINTAPTISPIAPQETPQNTATGAIPFTVGDAQTPAGNLTPSGSSSNTTLVPNANIVFGGGGTADRTVTVTPAANQSGVATITITVSDGNLSAQTSFQLTVLAPATVTTTTTTTPQTPTRRRIDAREDSVKVSARSGGTTQSVLGNDRFDGVRATTATVTPSLLMALPTGVTFNSTGTLTVAPNRPTGRYKIAYKICQNDFPSNCDAATITLELNR